MALRVEAGWDHDVIGEARCSVTDSSGTYNVFVNSSGFQHDVGGTTVVQSTTLYSHTPLFSVLGTNQYLSLGAYMALTLNDAVPGAVPTHSVTWDGAAQQYTWSVTSGTVAVTFPATDAGALMRRILGFSGNLSAAASHVSDVTPYYVINSARGGRSKASGPYRAPGRVEGSESLGGRHYATKVLGSLNYDDFTAMLETKAATFIDAATAAVPWTWEHFFDHCSAIEPFAVIDDVASTVHFLRPAGAVFDEGRRQRQKMDYDGFWNLRLLTYIKGTL